MLARTVALGLLLVGCAHAPVEKPMASPTRAPLVSPSGQPPDSAPAPTPAPVGKPVDFAHDVLPILESGCRPCHFAGGKIYDRLPLDRPQTVRQLGPRLLTHIKDERSQATLRAFLAQSE